jgi:spore coat protein A
MRWWTGGPTRILALFEIEGSTGPLEVTLNGQNFEAPVSEKPVVGTTEEWVIVDITEDAHPIHLHLVQFQLVSRQKLMADAYKEDWLALNGLPPYMSARTELAVSPYLVGEPEGPPAVEQGWKDTIVIFPGEVTIIRVRFTAQDGRPYPFDSTDGPGYVWHCHIPDHEDNEMMRPYEVVAH